MKCTKPKLCHEPTSHLMSCSKSVFPFLIKVDSIYQYTFFNSDSNKTIVQFNNQISATITASPPSSLQKKKNPKYVHLRDWSLNRLVDFSGEPITYQEECQDSSIQQHWSFDTVVSILWKKYVVFNFHSILQNMQIQV